MCSAGGDAAACPCAGRGQRGEASRVPPTAPTSPFSPLRRPARNLHFPSPPLRGGRCRRQRGGCFALATHRAALSILPPRGRCRRQRGEGRQLIPDTAEPCYHRIRTGVPFMRIPRNRADASPRPAESTRPRSPRLNLTEPRQTNLIAPSPPDQIGTTPQNPSQTEKSPETDHRRPRSPAPPRSGARAEMEMTRRSPAGGAITERAVGEPS